MKDVTRDALGAERPLILLEAAMPAPLALTAAGGSVMLYSAPADAALQPNEDAAAVFPLGDDSAVLVVADGAGGPPMGETAARLAVESMAHALRERNGGTSSLREAILDGFDHANQAVRALGVGAATTLAVVEIDHGALRPYHAGDSAILLTGQRGRLKLATMSHSPVAYAVQSGLLDASAALAHENLNLVSNMLGSPDMRIDVGSVVQIAARDTLVIASDGLFDNLGVAEIVDRVRAGPISEAASRLLDACREKMTSAEAEPPGKLDDLSFMIYRRR